MHREQINNKSLNYIDILQCLYKYDYVSIFNVQAILGIFVFWI